MLGNGTVMFLVLAFITVVTSTRDVCRFGSGSDCPLVCRCLSGRCDRETGECQGQPAGCIDSMPPGYGWGGPGCQVGNVAYGKTANQTGVLGHHTAELALDGLLYSDEDAEQNRHCAIPYNLAGPETHPAEWLVDLGAEHVIYNVTVFNTYDAYYNRLANFSLSITNSHGHELTCASHDGGVDPGKSVTLPCSGQGRYVTIKRNSGYEVSRIVLCEVVIMGFPVVDCSHCESPAICNQISGCSECPGALLPDCQRVCPNGTFGTNCRETCGQCAGPMPCDPVTGACAKGCMDGYEGLQCHDVTILPLSGTAVPGDGRPQPVESESCTNLLIPWILFGAALTLAVVFALALIATCCRTKDDKSVSRTELSVEPNWNRDRDGAYLTE